MANQKQRAGHLKAAAKRKAGAAYNKATRSGGSKRTAYGKRK